MILPLRALTILALFAAMALSPGASEAKSRDLPPASIGSDPRSWTSREGWHLRLGAPQRDTLSVSPGTALLAARTALEDDNWEVESSHQARPGLTTQWKAIHNLFFRLFSGKAFGRCFVTLQPLSNDRLEITFQGGLATRRNIEHTPVKGAAEHAYVSAARVWQREVRALVENRLSDRGPRNGGSR